MAAIIDPTSLGFLLAENRSQPMHVAGLQLFEPPADAPPDFARGLYEAALEVEEVAPLFRKRPRQSLRAFAMRTREDLEQVTRREPSLTWSDPRGPAHDLQFVAEERSRDVPAS